MLVRSPRFRPAASSPTSIRPGRELDVSSLYEAHHRELFRYCRSILHHDEDAMDALQATFAKAVAALPQETRNIEPRPWLFRLAHNESIGILRRRRTDSDIEDTPIAAHRSTHDEATQRADLHQLQEDLADLTERQRQALVLRELSGLGHEEIAAVLDTTPRAVKQVIYEARTALHECREGRTVACEDIRRQLSDADGRITRSRRLRAHIRDCSGCRAFQDDLARRPERLAAIAPVVPALAGMSLLQDLLARGADGVAGEALAGAASAGAAGLTASGALGGATAGSTAAAGGAATAATATAVTATTGAGLLGGVAAKVAIVAVIAGGGAGGAVLATDIGDRPAPRTTPSVTAAPSASPPASAPVATVPATSPGSSGSAPAAERGRAGQAAAAERREKAAERRAAARRRAAAAREKAAAARERGRGRGPSSNRRPATPGAPAEARPAPASRKPASKAPSRRPSPQPAVKTPSPAKKAPAPATKAPSTPKASPPAASAPAKPEPSGPAGGAGRTKPPATGETDFSTRP
jgi:RNA polymerase sigma factor (sigma-70 family)